MKNGITPIRYFHKDSPDLNEIGLLDAMDFIGICQETKTPPAEMTIKDLIKEGKLGNDVISKLSDEARLIIQTMSNTIFHYASFLTLQIEFLKGYEEGDKIYYNEREWRLSDIKFKEDSYFKFDMDSITHVVVLTEEERQQLIQLNIEQIKDKIHLFSELTQ